MSQYIQTDAPHINYFDTVNIQNPTGSLYWIHDDKGKAGGVDALDIFVYWADAAPDLAKVPKAITVDGVLGVYAFTSIIGTTWEVADIYYRPFTDKKQAAGVVIYQVTEMPIHAKLTAEQNNRETTAV